MGREKNEEKRGRKNEFERMEQVGGGGAEKERLEGKMEGRKEVGNRKRKWKELRKQEGEIKWKGKWGK